MSNNIWITSDLHLGHNKPFIYEARGFKTIQEHDKKIIENYNFFVENEDQVFILGDCFLGTDSDYAIELLKQLKGNKILIFGNHDNRKKIERMIDEKIFHIVCREDRIQIGEKIFILSHYPTIVANYKDKNLVYNICGHTHSKNKFLNHYHCYNACLDAHNNFPISLEEIVKDINYYNDRREFPQECCAVLPITQKENNNV